MVNLIRKYRIYLLVILSIVLLVAFYILTGQDTVSPTPSPRQSAQPPQSSTPNSQTAITPEALESTPVNIDNQASWMGEITPGKITSDELIAKLGEPTSQQPTKNGVTYSYRSESPNIPHEVTIDDDNTIVFINQRINDPNASAEEIHRQFKGDFYKLYGPDAMAGLYLFANISQGIAYYGTDGGKDVYHIWYFEPTNNIEEFVGKWASGYFLTETGRYNRE